MQTPLWTAVGAVPLLADGNSEGLGGGDSPRQAMESRLSAGDTGTIAASWRDEHVPLPVPVSPPH